MTTDGLRALTTLDTAASHRVKLLRFPLILLVLYIHCYLAPVRLGSSTVAVAPAMWLITSRLHGRTGSRAPRFRSSS